MTVREIYDHQVKKLPEAERVRLATMILSGVGPGQIPAEIAEDEKLAVAGARLAAHLGEPGEFRDWEKPGA